MIDDTLEREQLHFAAMRGDLDRVKSLVAAGYDVNAKDSDLALTPLHYAVQREHLQVVRFLLDAGADVNANDEATIGNTPLADVAGECSVEMAELLLTAGADPLIPGWMQLNALHRASRRTDATGKKIYAMLLAHTQKDRSGGRG